MRTCETFLATFQLFIVFVIFQGYYCPNGTQYATEYPCPPGTYRNDSLGQSADDCYLCPPGRYCANEANVYPDGPCEAGHFCVLGSATATPMDYNQFLGGKKVDIPGSACHLSKFSKLCRYSFKFKVCRYANILLSLALGAVVEKFRKSCVSNEKYCKRNRVFGRFSTCSSNQDLLIDLGFLTSKIVFILLLFQFR